MRGLKKTAAFLFLLRRSGGLGEEYWQMRRTKAPLVKSDWRALLNMHSTSSLNTARQSKHHRTSWPAAKTRRTPPSFQYVPPTQLQGVASYDAAGVAVGHARQERAPGVRISTSAVHPWLFRGFGTVLETQRQHAGTPLSRGSKSFFGARGCCTEQLRRVSLIVHATR